MSARAYRNGQADELSADDFVLPGDFDDALLASGAIDLIAARRASAQSRTGSPHAIAGEAIARWQAKLIPSGN